ncbi:peptidase M22, glycoprotease [Thalassoporum mexicanum PCC 7367]|uniref:peptidase M22 n=1 Tax=Thalassoporum mexicanum TaxID=3457544 RepID=UPI00029FE7D7|nr:peptidase M22 [Pseudanabaena sp. PCC 7367]AFY71544.1 peptidase M22, glycoprotease [Pseudanabaena sp. PCC 7367]
MKIALALHTTTAELGITIAEIEPIRLNVSDLQLDHLDNSESRAQIYNRSETALTKPIDRAWHLGRDLSHQIHTCLAEVMAELSWQDLVFIAIASGKGSFTSTRIGVVLARTLGQQLDLPVFAIDCDAISAYCRNFEPPRSDSQGLLELAFEQWQQGRSPNWAEALPIYGGSPV